MEMFIFKYLLTLSVFYNVIAAVVKETLEGDMSTEVSPQNDHLNARTKRQRSLGYYDYLHYLLDKHANSPDELLAAHKPLGPYSPYELHLFPHGLTHSAGEISDQYDGRLQQGVQIFPGFAPNVATPFAGFGQGPNFFPGFEIHSGINAPLRPIIDRTGRQKTICCSNRSRTKTKPKLRYKSQERNRGTINRNCSYSYRNSKKTETRKELRVSHENGAQINSHLSNHNSTQNSTHIFVLHLGANNCNCSKHPQKSTESSLIGAVGTTRGLEGEPNPSARVPARSSTATKSSESDFTAVFGSDIDYVSASIAAPSSKATSNNSSFPTTGSVPVPVSRHGSDLTPTPIPVSESASTLATNSGSASGFGSTSVVSSSFGPGVTSAADPRSSTTSTLASSDTFSSTSSSDPTLSSTTVSVPNSVGSVTVAVTADPSLASISAPASTPNPKKASTSSPGLTLSPTSVSSPNSVGSVTASIAASTWATDTTSASTSSSDSKLSASSVLAPNSVNSVTTSVAGSTSTTDANSASTSSHASTPNPRSASTSSSDSTLSPTSFSAPNSVGSVTASITVTDSSTSFPASTPSPRSAFTTSPDSTLKPSSVSAPNSGGLVSVSVTASTSVTDASAVSTSSPTTTPNPRSASTSSSETTLSSTSVSTLSSVPSIVPGSASTTSPEPASTFFALTDASSSIVSDADADSKKNSEAITTPTATPASMSIPASSEVTPSVSATVRSSKTDSASVTGLVSETASGSASTSTLDLSDKASFSGSKHVSLTASEFKSISKSELSSHSNSSVLSNDSHQAPAIGKVKTPLSSTPPTMSRKTSSHDDFESIPLLMDELQNTFVLETAQEPITAVNQSNVESGNVDLMTFLENLERIDPFPQTVEDRFRSSTSNTSTQSKSSTMVQTRSQSNISKAETHVALSNRQNLNSNQANINERKPDKISNDSEVAESIEDQGDHIVAISGTSMDLNVKNSNLKDIQHMEDIKDIEDIEKLRTMNDDLTTEPEPLDEIFFDDISEAEILRANNPSPIFEGAQDDDGTSTIFTENLSSSSFSPNSPVNDTTADVTYIPIKANGKFKALQFGSGFARTIADAEENNQDTLELEAGNTNGRLNDMTGTGSRFINILRSPNERDSFSSSEATFAEPLVSGVYTTKKKDFKYKSNPPPSIYWHRIEQKSHTTNSHLKELRPFESADFEYVRFPQDCVDSDELDEEALSAELKPRYPVFYTCNTHLT